MPNSKLKLSKNDVSVEFNLEKLLGSAAKDQTVRDVFFQTAFDEMLKRLESGRDVNGKLMSKYSKAYKNSLEYAAFHKTGIVNMELTGDMINSVNIQNQNSKKMTVGFDGEFNNTKAYAHMTGFEGHKTITDVAPRKFFGWTDNTLEKIARDLVPKINNNNIVADSIIQTAIKKLFG